MLILTRRSGETVRIGDDVVITVVGVKRHQVRIGVTAPRDVAVDREEIFERKHGARMMQAADSARGASADGRLADGADDC